MQLFLISQIMPFFWQVIKQTQKSLRTFTLISVVNELYPDPNAFIEISLQLSREAQLCYESAISIKAV